MAGKMKERSSNRRSGFRRGIVVLITVLLVSTVTMSAPAAAWGFFGWWGGTDDAQNPPGDEPVLLVHGFADASWTIWWDELESNLEEEGYDDDDIYRLDLGDIPGTTIDSPTEYSKQVCSKLKKISVTESVETGKLYQEVDIIGHSMGGLDARHCVEERDGAEYVDDLVTIATPHQGTEVAEIAFFLESGRDMQPGSDFLTDLNEDGLAENVDYTAVWGDWDEAVNPDENARIPRELIGETDVENVAAGNHMHINMVWSDDVFNDYKEDLD
ncbi:MAG: esterase/lipase family protein [Halobacteria archaeon]